MTSINCRLRSSWQHKRDTCGPRGPSVWHAYSKCLWQRSKMYCSTWPAIIHYSEQTDKNLKQSMHVKLRRLTILQLLCHGSLHQTIMNVSNLMSLKMLLFYFIYLYMFRAFLAHYQEILYCLVSRYGKRKTGCELWCSVISLVGSVSVSPRHCLIVKSQTMSRKDYTNWWWATNARNM
jgi:hypothetical protein